MGGGRKDKEVIILINIQLINVDARGDNASDNEWIPDLVKITVLGIVQTCS